MLTFGRSSTSIHAAKGTDSPTFTCDRRTTAIGESFPALGSGCASAFHRELPASQTFDLWIEGGKVLVDQDEITAWQTEHPQPYKRDEYMGLYADVHGEPIEPYHIAGAALIVTGVVLLTFLKPRTPTTSAR